MAKLGEVQEVASQGKRGDKMRDYLQGWQADAWVKYI